MSTRTCGICNGQGTLQERRWSNVTKKTEYTWHTCTMCHGTGKIPVNIIAPAPVYPKGKAR